MYEAQTEYQIRTQELRKLLRKFTEQTAKVTSVDVEAFEIQSRRVVSILREALSNQDVD